MAGQQESRGHDQNSKKDPDVHLAHSSSAAFEVTAFRALLSRAPAFDR
jgi:hypothetical protein